MARYARKPPGSLCREAVVGKNECRKKKLAENTRVLLL